MYEEVFAFLVALLCIFKGFLVYLENSDQRYVKSLEKK